MVSLELRRGAVTYRNGDLQLVTGVSKNLLEIIDIKEFDIGCVVMTARYIHGIVEEYLDLDWVLEVLGLSNLRDSYFRNIKISDICVKNYVDVQ